MLDFIKDLFEICELLTAYANFVEESGEQFYLFRVKQIENFSIYLTWLGNFVVFQPFDGWTPLPPVCFRRSL